MSNKLDAIECLLCDARGVYIPRDFIANFDMAQWGLDGEKDKWALDTCAAGPEEDGYWDAWGGGVICNKARYPDGEHKWELYQNGDLWAICYELLTDEEKQHLGFEE